MIFLIPFMVHHAIVERKNLEVQRQIAETQQAQYQLLLDEHNAHYGHQGTVTVKRGIIVVKR